MIKQPKGVPLNEMQGEKGLTSDGCDSRGQLTGTLGGLDSFGGLKEMSLENKESTLQKHRETVKKLVVNTNMKHGFNGPKLDFSSIIDKALYIVGKKTQKDNDIQYLDFLQDRFGGISIQELIGVGQKLRDKYIKPNSNDDEVTIPKLFLDLTLPKQLTGAKPTYGSNKLFFDTDIDKALYIVAQKEESKKNKEYLQFLKKQFSHHQFASIIDKDVSDTQLLERGQKIKTSIAKLLDKNQQNIPNTYIDIIRLDAF